MQLRKTALLTLVLLVLAAWAVAQQEATPKAPPAASDQQAPSAETTTVDGCLGGAAGNYTITDKSGMIYKLQVPEGNDATLEKHLGQQVQVTGMVEHAADAGSATPDSGKADSGKARESGPEASKAQATIKPTAMKKLADTCSSSTESPAAKK